MTDDLSSKIIKVGLEGYPKAELTPLSWDNLKSCLNLDNKMCEKLELAKKNKIDHYILLKELEKINLEVQNENS